MNIFRRAEFYWNAETFQTSIECVSSLLTVVSHTILLPHEHTKSD